MRVLALTYGDGRVAFNDGYGVLRLRDGNQSEAWSSQTAQAEVWVSRVSDEEVWGGAAPTINDSDNMSSIVAWLED